MVDEQVFENLSVEDIAKLGDFVSDPRGDTFVVRLPAGIAGATFARYSRAKGGWRTTFLKEFLAEGQLDPDKADQLIARVLVGYGDDSVGELEAAHLSFENVSNVATKLIEDSRLASYIEQSSRFVVYDQRDTKGRFRYLQDSRNPIMDSSVRDAFVKGMDRVFEVYCGLVKRLQDHLKTVKPVEEAVYAIRKGRPAIKISECDSEDERKEFKRLYNFDIRSKACDIARVLLPAATLTNVGVFCNGRAYQGMLTRLYSSDLPEMQMLGLSAHRQLNTVMKRYVERAGRDEFAVARDGAMQTIADELFGKLSVRDEDDVVLLDNEISGLAERVERAISSGKFNPSDLRGMHEDEFCVNMISYMLYKYVEHPMRQIRDVVRMLPSETQKKIYNAYHGTRRTRRDKLGRAFEYGYDLFFDVLGDFGIFRDLHRQRMLTQERQRLSARRGFVELHPMLSEIGAGAEVGECVDISAELYEKSRKELGRDVAQYPVLFGFNIRFCQGFNTRQADFYWSLRTGQQGHPSYRAVCQKMHGMLRQRSPWRANAMPFVDHNDYFWSRSEALAREAQKAAKLREQGIDVRRSDE